MTRSLRSGIKILCALIRSGGSIFEIQYDNFQRNIDFVLSLVLHTCKKIGPTRGLVMCSNNETWMISYAVD